MELLFLQENERKECDMKLLTEDQTFGLFFILAIIGLFGFISYCVYLDHEEKTSSFNNGYVQKQLTIGQVIWVKNNKKKEGKVDN